MHNPAPMCVEEVLDAEWISRSLSVRYPGTHVVGWTIKEQLETTATKIRLALDLAENRSCVPAAICIKAMLGEHGPAYAASGSSRTEALFYRECAALLPVRVPSCLYTGIDAESGHGLIIMEDVKAAGGRFLTALEPYSPDQARKSLAQMAAMHASAWQGNRIYALPWVSVFLDRVAQRPLVPLGMLQEMLDGPRGAPLPTGIRDAGRLHRGMVALRDFFQRDEQCLIHGDVHAGNLYEMNDEIALIDWQVFQRGHWAQDVAYHLGAALTPEQRRAQEGELLRFYLDALHAAGGPRMIFDDAWQRYRAGMLYGYNMWAVTRRVAQDITHEFVRRLGLAVSDLESFDLLGM